MPPRPHVNDDPDGDVFMDSPARTVMSSPAKTVTDFGSPMAGVSPVQATHSSSKKKAGPSTLNAKNKIKPIPVPYPLSPAKGPVELGANRDDISGVRWDRYQKVIEAKCDTCANPIHKGVIQTRFDKAFEPAGLSKNAGRDFLSSQRRARAELKWAKLEAEVNRFISLVLPDPAVEKAKDEELRKTFNPKTPFTGMKHKVFAAKNLKAWDDLEDTVINRLSKWAPEDFIDNLYNSELLEHKWAILSAWIWHYLEDCHFLSSRVKDFEDNDDDDLTQPLDLNRRRTSFLPRPRPSDLDGVDPVLETRSKAHRAWHILLEEFAPHRSYPGRVLAPGAELTAEQQQAENYAVAYDAWRKATQALMPRTSLTSEFPFLTRDVVPHLAQHLTNLLEDKDFPKEKILEMATHHMKNHYTGDPTHIQDPFVVPPQAEQDQANEITIARALIDLVEAAIEFRNDKDRDHRAWEVLFRPPPTADTWEEDKTAPPHSFPLDPKIMKVIADSRPPSAIYANIGGPSPGKRSRSSSKVTPPNSPGKNKGKGKEKAPLTSSGRQWRVVFVATPLLWENRFLRSGYTAFDQYHFNHLRVILEGSQTTKTQFEAAAAKRNQWTQFRGNDDDDSDDSEGSSYSPSDDSDYHANINKPKKKKAAANNKHALPTVKPSTTAGVTKRKQKKHTDDPAESPVLGVQARRNTRRASKEQERLKEREEYIQQRREEREHMNRHRIAIGQAPLSSDDDDEDIDDYIKRRKYHQGR